MNAPKPNSPPQLSPLEEQLSLAITHALQLERIIWLMANEQGGAMVIDEAGINPLWQTKYSRVEGAVTTLLRVDATQLPEPSDGQLQKLATLLDGQPEEATPEALLKVGLAGYPPSYLLSRLAPLAQCRDGIWKKT